jgi:hypothetical protein
VIRNFRRHATVRNGIGSQGEIMFKFTFALAALVAATSNAAFAENPLGAYVGLGVGESTVRSDSNNGYNGSYGGCGYYGGFGGGCGYDYSHHFAWKAEAGIRPISIAGAEVEYLDFGHPGSDQNYYYYDNNYGPDSHPRAIAAFAVGYLPLPVPFLDVYGKLGVARLHTNVNGFDGIASPACQLASCGVGGGPAYYVSESRWDTRFAYGVGLQTKFGALGVKAEYERINSPYGDPDIFTVGASWTF